MESPCSLPTAPRAASPTLLRPSLEKGPQHPDLAESGSCPPSKHKRQLRKTGLHPSLELQGPLETEGSGPGRQHPKSNTDGGSGSRPPVPELNSSYVVTGRLPGCGSRSALGVAVEGLIPGRLALAPPSNLPWSFLIFKDSFGVPGFPHVTKSPHLLPRGGPPLTLAQDPF
ncbi:hypothetical protein HJG60_010046 [Phyllostomus discolor]|uniref:Uncharacterized protein n=1 Tax=Phyllostomus discolor TaxID=89673 RepID=A0A834EG11_9CHIR|nr:hypothetical protein HJG60_010046 [Phyllostomus discolor]